MFGYSLSPENVTMFNHVAAAVLAGALIGMERSAHGRPAGFRTHTLVCMGSAMLMLLTRYQLDWLPTGAAADAFRTDPTRIAQGVMTGIGFLGAGVIYKENFSVRGLTTAASVWVTAAIGILFGAGMYFPGLLATTTTFCILSFFHHIEKAMPKRSYVHHTITFMRERRPPERELRDMIKSFGFNVGPMSYRMLDGGCAFEYEMTLRTDRASNIPRYVQHLAERVDVHAFDVMPSGD